MKFYKNFETHSFIGSSSFPERKWTSNLPTGKVEHNLYTKCRNSWNRSIKQTRLTPSAMSQPVPATCSGVTPLLLASTPRAFAAGCSPAPGAPGMLPGPTRTSTSAAGMTESGTTRSSTAHSSPLSDAEIALTSGDT